MQSWRVPLLSSGDPIPGCPQRILVAGTSGSGKTTLAARIGERLHLPHVEIDALFHGPGWTVRPTFETDVRWAWSTHSMTAERVQNLQTARPDLNVVRLTSRSDIEDWVRGPLREAGGQS